MLHSPAPALRGGACLQTPWLWLSIVLIVHSAAFFAFYPQAWLVHDETFYVRQAAAFAQGRATLELWDPARQAFAAKLASPYPPGTSLLMALPVRLFGLPGAFLVSWLSSLLLVLATSAWLQCQGHSPLFALLALAYPPTLVLSRLAMSDVPSAALVASALLLFTIGLRSRRPTASLAAGVLGGASLCLRETNPLLLLPLFVGAVLRRDRHAFALMAGTALGGSLRLLGMAWLFGDPLAHRPLASRFGVVAFASHLPLYLLATLCFVPGGLIWVLRYRGPRRPEILCTALGFVAFYAAYGYAGAASGFTKSLILAPRYLIPLTPVLSLCAAQAFATARASASRAVGSTTAALPAVLVASTCVLAIANAVSMRAYADRQAPLRRAIAMRVQAGDLVVTDTLATDKLMLGLPGVKLVDLYELADVRRVLGRAERAWAILLDRDDSDVWRAIHGENDVRLRALGDAAALRQVLDVAYAGGERLRIYRLAPR